MTDREPMCPTCRRRMDVGFLLDNGGSGPTQASWVAGPPERSRWSGIKLKGRTKLPITTYRCPRCGRLELFTPLHG